MKAKLIRPMQRRNPDFDAADFTLARRSGEVYPHKHSIDVPEGTEIDDPDAWRLVQMGVAVPVDDQCKAVCEANGIKCDADSVKRRAVAYEKIARGAGTGMRKYDSVKAGK